MKVHTVSEQVIQRVWDALQKYPSDDYLPPAAKLGQSIYQSQASITAAYRELLDRGYLLKRGKYYVKLVSDASHEAKGNKDFTKIFR